MVAEIWTIKTMTETMCSKDGQTLKECNKNNIWVMTFVIKKMQEHEGIVIIMK